MSDIADIEVDVDAHLCIWMYEYVHIQVHGLVRVRVHVYVRVQFLSHVQIFLRHENDHELKIRQALAINKPAALAERSYTTCEARTRLETNYVQSAAKPLSLNT